MHVHLSNHDHFVLLEASWNRPTGSYQSIMRRSVDEWYPLLRDIDRAGLLEWVTRFLPVSPDASSICGTAQRVWLGRYSPDAQFVASNDKGCERCFKVGDRYYTSSIFRVPSDLSDVTITPLPINPSVTC